MWVYNILISTQDQFFVFDYVPNAMPGSPHVKKYKNNSILLQYKSKGGGFPRYLFYFLI